jgi:hypothetical protein
MAPRTNEVIMFMGPLGDSVPPPSIHLSTTTFDPVEYSRQFHENGFGVFSIVLDANYVETLRAAIDNLPQSEAVRRKKSVYGVRNLLENSPETRRLAAEPKIRQFVTPLLGEQAFATRAIFFNKAPDANWSLGWHQDNVISVAEQIDVPGFVGWGQKAGVWQVQPPVEILSRMVAVRVHLDDCGPENGPLRVIPGSHRHGWLDDQISQWARDVPAVT